MAVTTRRRTVRRQTSTGEERRGDSDAHDDDDDDDGTGPSATPTPSTDATTNDADKKQQPLPRSTSSPTSVSMWSDVPRRLATICIGFPIVVKMIQHPTGAYIFFTGAHAISAWEYTLLEPTATPTSTTMVTTTTTTTTTTATAVTTTAAAAESTNSTTTTTTLERLMFCFVSVVLGSIPDPSSQSASSSSDSIFLCAISLTVGIFMMMMTTTMTPPSSSSSSPSSSKGTPTLATTTTTTLMRYYHWTVGLCLVTIPFRSWTQLAVRDFTSTLSVLLVVWNTDTGALVVGRLCNTIRTSQSRRSIIPKALAVPGWILRISPKKTMEGFLGGFIGGIWTANVWIPWIVRTFGSTNATTTTTTTAAATTTHSSSYFGSFLRLVPTSEFCWLWGIPFGGEEQDGHHSSRNDDGNGIRRILLGFILATLAIVGDLVESSIKRRSSSKDSGKMLPGHGGVLDRFDSSLLAVIVYQVLLDNYSSYG